MDYLGITNLNQEKLLHNINFFGILKWVILSWFILSLTSDFKVSGSNNAMALFRLLSQSGNTLSTYPWARECSVLDNTKVEKSLVKRVKYLSWVET